MIIPSIGAGIRVVVKLQQDNFSVCAPTHKLHSLNFATDWKVSLVLLGEGLLSESSNLNIRKKSSDYGKTSKT
jgi:hypothetical protein